MFSDVSVERFVINFERHDVVIPCVAIAPSIVDGGYGSSCSSSIGQYLSKVLIFLGQALRCIPNFEISDELGRNDILRLYYFLIFLRENAEKMLGRQHICFVTFWFFRIFGIWVGIENDASTDAHEIPVGNADSGIYELRAQSRYYFIVAIEIIDGLFSRLFVFPLPAGFAPAHDHRFVLVWQNAWIKIRRF